MTTHENLRKWMRANKVYFKDLARLVHVASLSYYFKTPGKLFPPEWIETWSKAYGWSDRETFLFQYERPYQEGVAPGRRASLLSMNLSLFDMKRIMSVAHMFEGCTNLDCVIPPSEDYWPECLYDVSYMFNGCKALRSVDVSFINFFDRSRGGLRIDGMFNNCTALRSVYVRSKEDAKVLESCRKPTGMQEFTKILVQAEV